MLDGEPRRPRIYALHARAGSRVRRRNEGALFDLEYEAAWHEGGHKENKPDTWLDLIASCERLIELGMAERGRIGIHRASAGGIAVGRTITSRPNLFGAVVSRVGMSNPMGAESELNGGPDIPEFGTVKEEAGFYALKAIGSYHAAKDGVDYPAVLPITGINDPRVEPCNGPKMVARLQRTSPAPEATMPVDWNGGQISSGDRAARLGARPKSLPSFCITAGAISSDLKREIHLCHGQQKATLRGRTLRSEPLLSDVPIYISAII